MANTVPPRFDAGGFSCPHCGILARQYWVDLYFDGSTRIEGHSLLPGKDYSRHYSYDDVRISVCYHCHKHAIWHKKRLVYPDIATVDAPNPDLPEDIAADYFEAASIVQKSPRAAAALLRLCIQKLCIHLELPGDNINADIKELVKRGLPEEIQMALDTVRVVGNNAVHPGKMDMRDKTAEALTLFKLVNIITDELITRKKRIAATYAALPESAREAIKKRDK